MKILNADPGFGRPLKEDEIRDFLTNGKLNIHIGTVDKKGEPNIHPTWYYFDATNNRFYIETSKNSTKIKNLRRNNIIYLLTNATVVDDAIRFVNEKSSILRSSQSIQQDHLLTNKVF
jgi:general stress protein 26